MAVAELIKEYSLEEAIETLHKKGVRTKYENYIGGRWTPPLHGRYFISHSPINTDPSANSPNPRPKTWRRPSTPRMPPRTIGAAHPPPTAPRSCCASPTGCRKTWNVLALAETLDNGKPIRETRNADVPLAIDHFRYFAACIRAEESATGELDENTIAYHFKEPLGVVGQIIPWNFPLLMAAWKLGAGPRRRATAS